MPGLAPSATRGDVCLTPKLWVCLGRRTAPRMSLLCGVTCCSPGSASHVLALAKSRYHLATCQHPTKYSLSFPGPSASSQPCTALQPQGLELLKKGDPLKSVNCSPEVQLQVLSVPGLMAQAIFSLLHRLDPSLAVLAHCWSHGFTSESGIEARREGVGAGGA